MAAKAMKTAEQINASWDAAMRDPRTQQKYKDGIARTTVNPMALAASPEAMDKYANAVQESVTSGRRAAALNNADPNQWKQNAQTVGASALATGATKSKAKHLKKMQQMAPVYAQASQAAAAATGVAAKVLASINTMRQAVGKPPLA